MFNSEQNDQLTAGLSEGGAKVDRCCFQSDLKHLKEVCFVSNSYSGRHRDSLKCPTTLQSMLMR